MSLEKNERLVYRDQASLMDLSPPLLLGDHQFANAATAISAVRTAGFNISSEAADLAMRTVNWPGRMQLLPYGSLSELSPEGAEIWIDGAHNPAAGSVIAQTLHQLQKTKPLNVFMIAGMISTKDHTGYFKAFYGLVQRVYTVPVLASPQGVPPCELASYAREAGLLAKPMDSVSHALNFLREENKGEKKPIRILISGSLYLIGSLLEENGTPPV